MGARWIKETIISYLRTSKSYLLIGTFLIFEFIINKKLAYCVLFSNCTIYSYIYKICCLDEKRTRKLINLSRFSLKWTVRILSSDPSCKDGYARVSTVSLKSETLIWQNGRYCRFLGFKCLISIISIYFWANQIHLRDWVLLTIYF